MQVFRVHNATRQPSREALDLLAIFDERVEEARKEMDFQYDYMGIPNQLKKASKHLDNLEDERNRYFKQIYGIQ